MNGKESCFLFLQSVLLLCFVSFLEACSLAFSEDLQYGHSATIGCYMQNLEHFVEIKWYRGLELIARCDGGGCTIANWERRHYKIIRGDNKSIVHIKSLRKEDAVKWNCKKALFNCYGTIDQKRIKSGGLYVHPLSGSVLLYDSYILQCTAENFDEPISWINGNGTELVSCKKPKSCSRDSSPDGKFSYSSIQQGIVIWIHSLHPDKDETFYCSQRRTTFKYSIDYKVAIDWGAQFTKVKIEKIENRVRCLCTIPGIRIEPSMKFILHNKEGTSQVEGSGYEIQDKSCFIGNCTYISYYLGKINQRTPPISCSCGVKGKSWEFYSEEIDYSKGRWSVIVPKLFAVFAVILFFCLYFDPRRLRNLIFGTLGRLCVVVWNLLKRKFTQKRYS
ncbi:hypothetical protein KUTeg_006111 [Tegillarca granosa]|uniref:Ig-like domain-containing protein n=1 Tax=Tegillarca granosa TaxID=220873 RepID=A0ABQ9FHU7_TEGGR|nr:hypothetical protein KUTeg_006111 [Tegillarca granosa]